MGSVSHHGRVIGRGNLFLAGIKQNMSIETLGTALIVAGSVLCAVLGILIATGVIPLFYERTKKGSASQLRSGTPSRGADTRPGT